MESKIIEYGIILSRKYKTREAEVISAWLLSFVTHKLQEYLVRKFTLSLCIFMLLSQ